MSNLPPATKAPSAKIVAPCPVTTKALAAGSYASKTNALITATKTTPRAGFRTLRKAKKRPIKSVPPPAEDRSICQDFEDDNDVGLGGSWLVPTPAYEAKRKKRNKGDGITELAGQPVSPPAIRPVRSISTSSQAAPVPRVNMPPVIPTLHIRGHFPHPEETVPTAPPPTTNPPPPVLQESPLPPTFKFPPRDLVAVPRRLPNPTTFSTSQSIPRASSEPTVRKVSPPSPLSTTVVARFSPIRYFSPPEVTQVGIRPECAPASPGQSRSRPCKPVPQSGQQVHASYEANKLTHESDRPVSAPTTAEVQQLLRPPPQCFSSPAPLFAPLRLRPGSRVTVNQGTYRGCSGLVQEVGQAGLFTMPGQWNVWVDVGDIKMKVMLPETFLAAC